MQADIAQLWREIESIYEALERHEMALKNLAPESAPPVPVTVPDVPPAAAGMTAEAFYAELAALDRRMFDGVPSGSVQEQRLRMCSSLLVDLGARWRAATGLPLPTRPKGPTR